MQKQFDNPSEAPKALVVLPTESNLATAAARIKAGQLVSFPTETVYGLGANALNQDACQLIYTTKKRPITDPLIVHIPSMEKAEELIDQEELKNELFIDIFHQLGETFWPGPLTMVVKANLKKIPMLITA